MTFVRISLTMAIAFSVIDPAGAQAPVPEAHRLTVEEAVRLALKNNPDVQVARIDPQIQDLSVAVARTAWFPTLASTFQGASAESPSNSFLSGAQDTKTSDDRLTTNVEIEQALPWGGRYDVGWDNVRSTTTNIFSNFSPQVRSSLALTYRRSLLRGFSIDSARQQVLVMQKNRDIADAIMLQTIALTSRAVRRAYWDLAYAIASLDLARASLRNTQAPD